MVNMGFSNMTYDPDLFKIAAEGSTGTQEAGSGKGQGIMPPATEGANNHSPGFPWWLLLVAMYISQQ